MPSVRVRDCDLYYEEAGTGPALLIAHGAFGSVHTALAGLRPQDFSGTGLRVIAYDARGHGRSGFSSSTSDYQRAARAQDLLGLMDALGIERAHVLGTSMGAGTALTLASQHAHRIGVLVLRSPPPYAGVEGVYRSLRRLCRSYQWLGVALTARLCSLLPQSSSNPRLLAQLAQQRRAAVIPMIRGLLAESFYPEYVHDIQAPTLIVGHAGDPSHPTASAQWLCDTLPHARLLLADSKRHWDDHPEILRGEIFRFLADTSSAAATTLHPG